MKGKLPQPPKKVIPAGATISSKPFMIRVKHFCNGFIYDDKIEDVAWYRTDNRFLYITTEKNERIVYNLDNVLKFSTNFRIVEKNGVI